MAEIFRNMSDALNLIGPGILGDGRVLTYVVDIDGNELAACTLLVLQREHPCQVDEDAFDDLPNTEDDEIAEIEGVLLDAAVDVVIALAKVLEDQFAAELDPFYMRLLKFSVSTSCDISDLQRSKTASERSMGIAALGEITGALKGSMIKHTGELLALFFNSLDDPAEEVATNSIYGLGLLLESTPQNVSRYFSCVYNG